MSFCKELNLLKEIIDLEIKKILPLDDLYQKKVIEAMEYSIFSGGKRLRPIMTLKSCEIFKGDYEDGIPYAIAIEMIHTYSLIHDDLPSMDDDDFRRGKPTSHKVYGEAMAILAGDGLLNLAFESVLDFISKEAKDIEEYKRYIRALKEIGNYSGINGMIGGQVVDLQGRHDTMTKDKLNFMYRTKTAALIEAALVSGAIIGNGNDSEIEIMREFGYNLGMAYQIRDDILDFEEDKAIDKLTYLTFYDMEKAKAKVREYSENGIKILNKLKGKDINFFAQLTKELIIRDEWCFYLYYLYL